jgi:hypothetical protein
MTLTIAHRIRLRLLPRSFRSAADAPNHRHTEGDATYLHATCATIRSSETEKTRVQPRTRPNRTPVPRCIRKAGRQLERKHIGLHSARTPLDKFAAEKSASTRRIHTRLQIAWRSHVTTSNLRRYNREFGQRQKTL